MRTSGVLPMSSVTSGAMRMGGSGAIGWRASSIGTAQPLYSSRAASAGTRHREYRQRCDVRKSCHSIQPRRTHDRNFNEETLFGPQFGDPRPRRVRHGNHPQRYRHRRIQGPARVVGRSHGATRQRPRRFRAHVPVPARRRQPVIDARVRGNAARWINHSCDPNCTTFEDDHGRVFIEAKRKIRPGEELAYDYRLHIEGRLSKRERAQYACRCGAGKCRGSLLDKVADDFVTTGGRQWQPCPRSQPSCRVPAASPHRTSRAAAAGAVAALRACANRFGREPAARKAALLRECGRSHADRSGIAARLSRLSAVPARLPGVAPTPRCRAARTGPRRRRPRV